MKAYKYIILAVSFLTALFSHYLGMSLVGSLGFLVSGIVAFIAIQIKRKDIAIFATINCGAALILTSANYTFCGVSHQSFCTMQQVDALQKGQWEMMKEGDINSSSLEKYASLKWRDLHH